MSGDKNYLFVTEVGSRMWGMEKFASDYDLFHCYQQPAREYLRTSTFEKSRPAKKDYDLRDGVTRELDCQYMEIGHLVNLLKKGNVNAIWAVCSPVVHQNSQTLRELKQITLDNLSRASYASIKGMAMSELSDATKRKDVRDPQKNLQTCIRTLWFGQDLFLGRKLSFTPVSSIVSEQMCSEEFAVLDSAYESSNMREKPDPVPFDDFLFRIRMKEILDNHISIQVK
jgi:predicted nucleotidyltransferase